MAQEQNVRQAIQKWQQTVLALNDTGWPMEIKNVPREKLIQLLRTRDKAWKEIEKTISEYKVA